MIRAEEFRALFQPLRGLGSCRRFCPFARVRFATIFLAVFLPLLSLFGFSEDSVDVHTIIERSVRANNADWQRAPAYDYFETDRDDQGTKTYQVTMILGSPYERLVAVNEQPLPEDKRQAEQHKLEQVVATRRKESPRQRAQRIAKYERGAQAGSLDAGTTHRGIRLQAARDTEARSPRSLLVAGKAPCWLSAADTQTKVLTGMEGQLWIDRKPTNG